VSLISMHATLRITGRATATGHSRLRALLALSCLCLAGCPKPPAVEEAPVQQAEVVSFSEGSPVRSLVAIPPYVFSASRRGLDRWGPSPAQSLQLSAEHGLPGDHVESMAHDPMRNWLWIATDSGITRYELGGGTFSEIPVPPPKLDLMPLTPAVIEPAGDGGLWLGHARGLFYASPTGGWSETAIRERITALHRTPDGTLWAGTERGIIQIVPGGDSLRYGATQGCDVERVRFIATAPGDVPLVVGDNAAGEQRVVIMVEQRCASYRVAPSVPWLSAARRGSELLVLTPGRVYSLQTAPPAGPRGLRRDGMRLLPVVWNTSLGPAAKNPFTILSLDEVEVPAGARILAASSDEILVGTHNLGTVRFARGSTVWLRRGELVAGATKLSVACVGARDCYLGTGSRGWHFEGDGFSPVERPGSGVLAFARSPRREIYAVVRGEDERRLFVERLDGSTWARVSGVEIDTPGVRAEVPFARFGSDGVLWVGLQYREELGALRPYGLAHVDVSRGTVRYHGGERRTRRSPPSLAVPSMVTELAFLESGEAWLASTEGAVQIRDGTVVVHRETERGLKTELVRGIATSRDGKVFVASRAGVGVWDGKSWTYPELLRDPVNDVAVGRDGRLWMATDRGLAVYDGSSVRNIDTHRGMLENQIDEAVIDAVGRVWVRSSKGISIAAP
jgi:hypothetical protein